MGSICVVPQNRENKQSIIEGQKKIIEIALNSFFLGSNDFLFIDVGLFAVYKNKRITSTIPMQGTVTVVTSPYAYRVCNHWNIGTSFPPIISIKDTIKTLLRFKIQFTLLTHISVIQSPSAASSHTTIQSWYPLLRCLLSMSRYIVG